MIPANGRCQVPIPPPSYHRAMRSGLHVDALTVVTRLHLLALCRIALRLSQGWCSPPLPAGPAVAHGPPRKAWPDANRFQGFAPTLAMPGQVREPARALHLHPVELAFDPHASLIAVL